LPYSGNKYHPSQKPIEALGPLVTAFSKQNAIVLDPFAGSFSTGVAAKQLTRRFIDIELAKEYHCRGAERRRNTK
jgi:adenine-specific DNA-methyltransferase